MIHASETVHYRTCNLCEAMCGIEIRTRVSEILAIKGDVKDPFSRGHICPKAVALKDVQEDPNRIKRPMRRVGNEWQEISWDEALSLAGKEIGRIRKSYGRDAVATYVGNPATHHTGTVIGYLLLRKLLNSRNTYSASSVDQLPMALTLYQMFGHQALFPIPDIDRTEYMLILGANPLVSNGSIMTSPDIRKRLKAIQERGGKIVVIDPRRTQTARLADRHHFIRPGSDVMLLLGLLSVVFNEGLVKPGRLEAFTDGIDELAEIVRRYPAERVAPATGLTAGEIEQLAREFASAEKAVCYGRLGTCTQAYGTLSSWLITVLNIVTGNLDRPGGAMFPTPAVDMQLLLRLIDYHGSYDRYRSRVRDLPEFAGDYPIATLADEIGTPGEGQVKGLITVAGNPVLSAPNGARLGRAMAHLEFMISVDIYLNETTRHADLILPPVSVLEKGYYDLVFPAVAVRNTAKYNPQVFSPPPDSRDDWQIFGGLVSGLVRSWPGGAILAPVARGLLSFVTPDRLVDLAIRFGDYGRLRRPFGPGLTLSKIRRQIHGMDLGPLLPRLPRRLFNRHKRINLVPALFRDHLSSLDEAFFQAPTHDREDNTYLLIGRRHLRSNNSWMHNSPRLVKGPDRCTAQLNPQDASRQGIGDGQLITVSSPSGSIEIAAELSIDIRPGVVSIPHGWGHRQPGTRLSVARKHPGVSVNDITDDSRVEALSGVALLSGIEVQIAPVAQAPLVNEVSSEELAGDV